MSRIFDVACGALLGAFLVGRTDVPFWNWVYVFSAALVASAIVSFVKAWNRG